MVQALGIQAIGTDQGSGSKAASLTGLARNGSLLGFLFSARGLSAPCSWAMSNPGLNLSAFRQIPGYVPGASWNWPDIPLRPRYLCIPMGYWPFPPGCRCPKCHCAIPDRSQVGWCIICGKFGCSSCCQSVSWRRCCRNRLGRAIKTPGDWMCATWGLVLQGRPLTLGWRTRAIHVCDVVSCMQNFHIASFRMEEHRIDLQLSYVWK